MRYFLLCSLAACIVAAFTSHKPKPKLKKKFKGNPIEFIEWLNDRQAVIAYYGVNFRGRSTVWHNASTGKRASTFLESKFSDAYVKAEWDRDEMIPKEPKA